MQPRWLFLLLLALGPIFADEPAPDGKAAYVHAVTRGAGLVAGQTSDISEQERAFRAKMEARKDAMLAHSDAVAHPVIYTPEDLARAKKNAASSEWAQGWVKGQINLADEVLAQPDSWVDDMLPREAPAHAYGFTCPSCVGKRSQEATGYELIDWNWREPDHFKCRTCGEGFPNEKYPETATLQVPRLGYSISYYLNDAERANPEDHSGKLAWHWVGYPIHVSFSGLIREQKIGFLRDAARSLAFAYAFTGDVRYVQRTRDILVAFAQGYRKWPYRDYWDSYADCDPLYAAWHDKDLPLEWKRHLCEDAYAEDTNERAGMLQTYWGAGRVHPSTDSISGLGSLALAYDLTVGAGAPVWSPEDRRLVERDLLAEYILGAEPFVGGENKADNANNKSPRVYTAMAYVAKCLGIPALADTALRGYERVRDNSFLYDGFSKESPSYNNMYLSELLVVPEVLHGFTWPADFAARQGTVDYYSSDPRLRLMYRGVLWTLRPDGAYLPLSDSHQTPPSDIIVHMGLRRFPDLYAGAAPALKAAGMGEYGLFNLTEAALKAVQGLRLPETNFPGWQTAILRHGEGPDAAVIALPYNPPGGHRQRDSLALYYAQFQQAALGDLGYVGDMPMNDWIRSSFSHNLVMVDDQEQRFEGRAPQFNFMATSPVASVIEAASNAYEQCSDYRRLVVLLKGPDNQTLALDIFRVQGGAKHAFRVYSEFAASDSANGSLEFTSVTLPPEAPLPEIGASLAHDDIFGLRDMRSAAPDATPWQATWKDSAGKYRLTMVSPCDHVEASNGPGQRTRKDSGRRVRYVDAVREGASLSSTFIAVHEIASAMLPPLIAAESIPVPGAGPQALCVRVTTQFADFYVFSECETPVDVRGMRFQGRFGIIRTQQGALTGYLTLGSTDLRVGPQGYKANLPAVAGEATLSAPDVLLPAAPVPAWPRLDPDAQAYVRVKAGEGWVGVPIETADEHGVRVKDYPPPPEASGFELMSVRCMN